MHTQDLWINHIWKKIMHSIQTSKASATRSSHDYTPGKSEACGLRVRLCGRTTHTHKYIILIRWCVADARIRHQTQIYHPHRFRRRFAQQIERQWQQTRKNRRDLLPNKLKHPDRNSIRKFVCITNIEWLMVLPLFNAACRCNIKE